MPFSPEVTSVNQKLQFGAESTSNLGVNVAATKLILCYDLQWGPMADVKMYEGTGRKYPAAQIENSEWVEGTVGGYLDYNGIVYLLASTMGSVSPVAHGASTTAKDWVYTPPLTGTIVPQTYTIEQGDAVRARKVNYGLISEYTFKGDRQTGIQIGGKVLAQALQDGITMTGSPTTVALAPMAAKPPNGDLTPPSPPTATTQLETWVNLIFIFAATHA